MSLLGTSRPSADQLQPAGKTPTAVAAVTGGACRYSALKHPGQELMFRYPTYRSRCHPRSESASELWNILRPYLYETVTYLAVSSRNISQDVPRSALIFRHLGENESRAEIRVSEVRQTRNPSQVSL
jgi:hypothetical protein